MIATYVRCDRCRGYGEVLDHDDRGPRPPEGWRSFSGPVRGSQGAKSDREYVLCPGCGEELFVWLSELPGVMS